MSGDVRLSVELTKDEWMFVRQALNASMWRAGDRGFHVLCGKYRALWRSVMQQTFDAERRAAAAPVVVFSGSEDVR